MRITFVKDGGFSISGGDRVIAIYAEALHRRGHTVEIVARPGNPVTLRDRVRAIVKGRPMPRAGHHPSHFDGLQVPRRSLSTKRPVVAADLPDADIVVATWWETAEWVDALPPSKGAKAYFIQHYEAFADQPQDRVDATWRMPLHKIVIAGWLQDMAARFGDFDAVRVPNSVDTAQFHAPERGRQAMPTIGMLYHGSPWKGLPLCVEATERIAGRFPALRLRTFGHEPSTVAWPANVDHVHVLNPAQDEIRHIYGACDVWLCGSRSEGFGLPCLEAMACRTPVISTRCGGPEDFIADGDNGFLVPIDDAAAMAERIGQVLGSSADEWRRLSDAAHRTATSYSWDDATDLFEGALERWSRGAGAPDATRLA